MPVSPTPRCLGSGEAPDLGLFDPTIAPLAELEQRARTAEQAARAVPGVSNSNGASAGSGQSLVALATSTGFARAVRSQPLQLLGQRHRGRGRRPAARLCLAQHPLPRRPRRRPRRSAARRANAPSPASTPPGRRRAHCPVIFDPRVSLLAARPFRRGDHRQRDRAQDQLPSGRARHPAVRPRHHHPRRSAAAARPAQPGVRRRGPALPPARPRRRRRADQLARDHRRRAPARHRTRPATPAARSAEAPARARPT